ncbi:hypothetical protein DERF_003016, partial [Dermatophagoides farinae]
RFSVKSIISNKNYLRYGNHHQNHHLLSSSDWLELMLLSHAVYTISYQMFDEFDETTTSIITAKFDGYYDLCHDEDPQYPCIGVSKLTIITTTTIESITSRYFNIRNNNNHHNYKDGVALDF